MIKGIGIDIIEIERIHKALTRNNRFLERIFTEKEIEYFNSKNKNANTIAGFFAAKEAVSKAFGTGLSGFNWTDIEICKEKSGKPSINLHRKARELAKRKGISDLQISISHSKENAVAFAIAEGESKDDENTIADQKTDENSCINKEMISKIIPKRKTDSHKGTYGKVGIIGGSKGMTGAVALSLKAAFRSGSGLVYSIVPETINDIIETLVIEAISLPIKCHSDGYFNSDSLDDYLIKRINELDCLVLGPGMGVDKDRISFVRDILLSTDKPLLLDADGLNCVSKDKEALALRTGTTIITPHPAELSRLIDISVEEIQSNRIHYCKYTSKLFNVITVLKGANTVISNPKGDVFLNSTGNPGMATAGSGDVLSGIIASFIGQKIEPFFAAVAGVYIHGLAGDIGAEDKGEYGLIAGDIVDCIPYAIERVKKV